MIFKIIFFLVAANIYSQSHYLFKFIQAAPGKIEILKSDLKNIKSDLILQHKQGESWDFLIIKQIDIKSFFIKQEPLTFAYQNTISQNISNQNEIILKGPDYKLFREIIQKFSLFHLESFDVLPGKEKELYQEREMENKYFKEINFDGNFIFTRVFGSDWDLITLGYYRSLTHFASQEKIPFEKDDKAAKKAGFKGVSYIGSYLRSLILKHQDSFAKKIN